MAAFIIDPATGVVTIGAFRVDRRSAMRELRTIDPAHFQQEAADGENFFCRFAEFDSGIYRIACASYHRNGLVLYYTFTPFVPGETWEDYSDVSEKRKLAFLLDILGRSGVPNHQDFTWGHVGAEYDGRSAITSLCVAYYRRQA